MNKIYNLAIIGGGAGGLAAAVTAEKSGLKDVIIIERLNRLGKKLLVTGNGQGNVSNTGVSPLNYYGEDEGFVTPLINKFDYRKLENFFGDMGLILKVKEDGRAYPYSMQASSVSDHMRAAIENKVEVALDAYVKEIKKGKYFTIVCEDGRVFAAENIIVATGGSASKANGTDGSSYSLVTRLGHKLSKIYPSLVQVKTETSGIRSLKGLKALVKVYAYDKNSLLKSSDGEILFTEYGISGPAVFQVSGHLAKAEKPLVKIEFLPELSNEEIEKILIKRKALSTYKKGEILNGLMNKRIAAEILKSAKGDKIKDVISALKNFTLKVTGNTGFNNAQVTKGGILTKDVDPVSFESKIVKGLYIVGEALDVDGDCGGFNLHFAFSSGISAAEAVLRGYGLCK